MMQKLIKEKGENKLEAKEVWKKIAQYYGMHQFFDEEGNFVKASFNGSRGTYHNFYYYPIKVLEHLGKIDYSKSGKITVLSNEEIRERKKDMEKVSV